MIFGPLTPPPPPDDDEDEHIPDGDADVDVGRQRPTTLTPHAAGTILLACHHCHVFWRTAKDDLPGWHCWTCDTTEAVTPQSDYIAGLYPSHAQRSADAAVWTDMRSMDDVTPQ